MAKFIPIILPQPGEDLRTWARQLTSQLQSLTAQLSSVLANIEVTEGGGGGTPTPGGTTTPVKTPDDVTILDANGYYIDGLGRVIVDANGFHVYDLVGFQVINGPNVYINTEHLVENAVKTAQLAAGAVTEVKIDNDAITAPKIKAGAIVAGKLAANAIVANDGVIGTAAIADAQIIDLNANKITAGSIAAERMEANIVTALNGKFATLSALASSLGAVQILSGGALFTQGAIAYATGTGVWMGQDGGAYKWRAGNPAGARIQWTGSALEVYNSSNQLTIASGNVDWAGVINKTGFAAISQITSSNVTTYIDNAALGNAQIGGNLWSTNWNYAGGTGWLLDRSGNFYGNNIYARGDIEASSLKANTAMVNTLHIGGNAVTVPVSAFTAGAISANSYPAGWSTVVIQTAWIDAGGSPVFVTGTCAVFFNPNISSFFDYFELVAPSGAVITRSGRVYTNQGSSDTISISGVSYEAGTYQFRARTYLNASYSQSSWEISYRGLNLLGTKR